MFASKRQSRKIKKENKYAADFLGASSESSVFGLTGREEVTYGRARTARLSALDLRKRMKVSSMENPEIVKFPRRRKTQSNDIYSENYKSNLTKTKQNIFGSSKKNKTKLL